MDMWEKPYYTADINHNWTGALSFPRKLSVVNNRLIQSPYNVSDVFKTELNYEDNLTLDKTFRLKAKVNTSSPTNFKFGSSNDFFEINVLEDKLELDTSKTKLYPMEKRYVELDRKSTRLNSSHVRISYAVFCLKKKNKQKKT